LGPVLLAVLVERDPAPAVRDEVEEDDPRRARVEDRRGRRAVERLVAPRLGVLGPEEQRTFQTEAFERRVQRRTFRCFGHVRRVRSHSQLPPLHGHWILTHAITSIAQQLQEDTMQKYVIERTLPGAGKLTMDELAAISQKSNEVLDGMAGRAQWIQSYVT